MRMSAIPRGGRVTQGDGGRLLRAEMRQEWRQMQWARGWQHRPVERQSLPPPRAKANAQQAGAAIVPQMGAGMDKVVIACIINL